MITGPGQTRHKDLLHYQLTSMESQNEVRFGTWTLWCEFFGKQQRFVIHFLELSDNIFVSQPFLLVHREECERSQENQINPVNK